MSLSLLGPRPPWSLPSPRTRVSTRQRSKAQDTQWQVLDEVWQAAKEWIDMANKNNVVRMQTEMRDVACGAPQTSAPSTLTKDDQLWDALTSSRISLPLHKLLPLMPRFRDTLAALQATTQSVAPPVNLTEPGTGPPLMDSQNPVVKIIIKGQDLYGCIIDGDSGVNVISEETCHNQSLYQWEPCPFWLWMADTRSVRPIGLIRHLEFTLGGHMFTISAIVLRLDAQGTYPLLLQTTVTQHDLVSKRKDKGPNHH